MGGIDCVGALRLQHKELGDRGQLIGRGPSYSRRGRSSAENRSHEHYLRVKVTSPRCLRDHLQVLFCEIQA